MARQKVDLTVVGGGVIGLCCAYFANRAGLSVRILERDSFGQGASLGNMGLITPSHAEALCRPENLKAGLRSLFDAKAPLKFSLKPDLSLLAWLNRFAAQCTEERAMQVFRGKAELLKSSRMLVEKLIALEKLSCEFSTRGVLLVCKTDEGMNEVASLVDHCEAAGIGADLKSASELRQTDEALRDDLAGGVYFPDDASMRPDLFCSQLAKVLERNGVEMIENCDVQVIHQEKGQVESVFSEARGLFPTSNVVVCTGVYGAGLGKVLGVNLPLQPGKGYTLTMARPNPCPAYGLILHERSMAVTPWKKGYRLGGTMEFSGFDGHLNKSRLDMLVEGAMEYLIEGVAPGAPRKWAGFRPMTPDDLPIIGPAGPKGAFMACGHNMLGMSMAAGTGRLITEMVKGKKPHVDPSPYDPYRFKDQPSTVLQRWWRDRKQAKAA